MSKRTYEVVEEIRLRDRCEAFARGRGWSFDRRGECHVQCPNCGKEPKSGQTHFSFGWRGGSCFVCGFRADLDALLPMLGETIIHEPNAGMFPHSTPSKPPRWKQSADDIHQRYQSHPRLLSLWQSYKPLSLETILHWQLGAGVLVGTRCKRTRLVVPIIEGGKIVGFRGRLVEGLNETCNDECQCPKWLSSAGIGQRLFNIDALVTDIRHVVIVENNVDVIIATHAHQQLVRDGVISGSFVHTAYVAPCNGSSSWDDAWTERIKAINPLTTTCWYDNDFPGGMPNRTTRNAMIVAWKQKYPGKNPPELSNGERLLERLSRGGVRGMPFEWPKWATPKMDIGQFFMQSGVLA